MPDDLCEVQLVFLLRVSALFVKSLGASNLSVLQGQKIGVTDGNIFQILFQKVVVEVPVCRVPVTYPVFADESVNLLSDQVYSGSATRSETQWKCSESSTRSSEAGTLMVAEAETVLALP